MSQPNKKQRAGEGKAKVTEGGAPEGGEKRKQPHKQAGGGGAPPAQQQGGQPGKNAAKNAKKKANKKAAAQQGGAPKQEGKAQPGAAGNKKKKGGAPQPKGEAKQSKAEKKAAVKAEAKDDDDEDSSVEIKAIDAAQKALEDIYNQQGDEVDAIERKYGKIRRPKQKARDAAIKKVPGFWAQAFANHELIGGLLDGEADRAILGSLVGLDVEENDDYKTGMKIIMEFSANDYFSNSKIVKEYIIQEGEEPEIKITPEIQWKDAEFPTDDANRTGFFVNWFNPNEAHAEIAEYIRDEIYRDPLGVINSINDAPHLGSDDEDGEGDGEGDEGLAALLGGDDDEDDE